MILQNKLKAVLTILLTFVSTYSMAMTKDELAQFKIGLYVMLTLLVIGVIGTIIFIRRKKKDKNGKVDARAYSASQKQISGPDGINNFFDPNLR